MPSIGDECIDRPVGFENNISFIPAWSSFTKRCRVYSFCTYARENCSIKVKVFRNNGINFIYVGGSDLVSVVSGLNTIPFSLVVEPGDLIGLYTTGGTDELGASSVSLGTRMYYAISGDITSDTLISDWIGVPDSLDACSLRASYEDIIRSNVKLGKTLSSRKARKK